jgi:hypothetical protein
MATITASTTEYSDQINKIEVRSDPAINVLDVIDLGARIRHARVDFTAVANIAEDVYVRLAKLPRSARIVGMHLYSSADEATSDLVFYAIPVSSVLDDGDLVQLATHDSSAAGLVTLAIESYQSSGNEVYVLVKTAHDTSGTVIALGDTIKGHISYVV